MIPSASPSTETTPQAAPATRLSPSAMPFPSVELLGLRIDALTQEQALSTLEGLIPTHQPHQVVLANAYTIAACHKEPSLKTLINQSDIVLADGMSMVWGARWLNIKIPERIAGVDLTESLCSLSAKKGYRVFLMGSSPETLDQLRKIFLSRWPSLALVGTHSPSVCDQFDERETQTILDEIHRCEPDILFVSLSAPKQERWIAQNKARLKVPLCIGVGAAFNFLSGSIPRAPEWLQRSGLEWLYRLYREPRRLWKRYLLGNAIFLSLLARAALHRRLHAGK